MYSDDILAEREQMDETKQVKKNLLGELNVARETNHTLAEEASANDQNDKIKKLREQRQSQALMMQSKIEQLVASKNEIEDQFVKALRLQEQENH